MKDLGRAISNSDRDSGLTLEGTMSKYWQVRSVKGYLRIIGGGFKKDGSPNITWVKDPDHASFWDPELGDQMDGAIRWAKSLADANHGLAMEVVNQKGRVLRKIEVLEGSDIQLNELSIVSHLFVRSNLPGRLKDPLRARFLDLYKNRKNYPPEEFDKILAEIRGALI